MATQPTTSTSPPGLSSFLAASQDWLGEEYAGQVVKLVLDAREQLPSEIRRPLGAAIRSSGVRVPGAQFQHRDVEDAPTHHLQSPVLRKIQSSDELAEAVLRAWVGIRGDLYESVVQHLQWNDEPTYGPDRRDLCFRGFWDARDWQTNYNQFLADRTGFDSNDVGLMLWYVSGKLPPPHAEVEDPSERVDFERWKELLLALRPDASQWEYALEFAAAIGDIVAEKEKQRARDAVNQLKTKVEDIWIEFSEELVYLEKSMARWSSARNIQPEEALETLARVENLESLLSQYRPIRDQAQSRSVESSRAGRRAELEAEIISTVTGLEPVFDPSADPILTEPELAIESDSPEWEAVLDQEGFGEATAVPADIGDMEPDDLCEELLPVELLVRQPELEGLTPLPDFVDGEPEELTPGYESLDVMAEELTRVSGTLQPAPDEVAHLDAVAEELTPVSETLRPAPDEVAHLDAVAEELTPVSETLRPTLHEEPVLDTLNTEPEALMPSTELLDSELGQGRSNDVNVSILAGLQSLREDLEQLKEQLSGSGAPGSPADNPEVLEDGLTLDLSAGPQEHGLEGAVMRAREWHSNRLIFRLNAESWVEGNPYEDHQSVSDALEWLAVSYFSARQGEFDHAQLNDSLYRACRWKYSSNQSDNSFFQSEGHYRMLVNGRAYFLNETIGKGVGEDPVNAIRIAFYWDRQRQRVVIGYIGQHKPDANP